jgi:threonine aldolase
MTIHVDLRSDTVTQPSQGMRLAMAAAMVGDDVYGEDPTVRELEARVAASFGHQDALFLPTGTMSNQVAIQSHVPRGEELLADADAHIVTYESGAAAALGGISTRTYSSASGLLDIAAVAGQLRDAAYFTVPTRAIAVEQTANRAGGLIQPLDALIALRTVADDAGVAVHCDGARIWNAHVATGIPLERYGRLFDTLSVCLSKGLGAPAGSLMVGSSELIRGARHLRKRLGGAMRQAGILAAAGIYALDHHLPCLAEDHRRAAVMAAALASHGVLRPGNVHTNMVLLDLSYTDWNADAFAAEAAERGVRFFPVSANQVRLVLHMNVTDNDVDYAIDTLSNLLQRRQ